MVSIQILWLVGEVENGCWTWSLEEILVPVYNDSDMPFSVALQKVWLENGEWTCIYLILMISYISRAIQSAEADQSIWNSELKVLPSVLDMYHVYHVFHSSSAAVGDLSEERTHLYFTSSPSPMGWRRILIRVKVKHSLLAIQDEMRKRWPVFIYFPPCIVERWTWGGGRMTGAMSAERCKLRWYILP